MNSNEESFINQLKNFVKELRILFPKDNIFSVAEYTIKLYTQTDRKKMIRIFNTYFEKYKQQIEQKDETFFMAHKDYDFNSSTYTENIIERLKTYWVNLDDDNKESIWLYLQVLCKLCQKCI